MKVFNILIVALVLVFGAQLANAQDEQKMKKEDWTNEMNNLNGQQGNLQYQIDSLNKSITGTKEEGDKVNKETEDTWSEIYALLGTDKAGVDAMKKQLADLETRLNDYAKMSDEALSKIVDSLLVPLKNEIDANKKDKRYALTEIFNKVNDLSNRADQLIQRGKNYTPPKPRHDTYVVNIGDYLWRISGKKDVYSDPYQWIKIYSANRDQIRNPDLIYPNQSFTIPRAAEANEYWVERGDYMKGIAQKVYGNPSDWVKIYNANKKIIGEDASRIYPHTILIIPK